MELDFIKRTWAEIDLDAIQHNYRILSLWFCLQAGGPPGQCFLALRLPSSFRVRSMAATQTKA